LDAPCTFAHHPMLRLSRGGRIAVGAAARIHTFDVAEEPGHDFYLRGQAATGDMLETRNGPHPWRDYPATACEDFLAVVGGATGLGWTAVQRRGEGDTILFLKRAEQLPLTCLWISNGGRDHRPWDGEHRGVLGVEDAVCAGADGFAAALSGRTRLSGSGVRLCLPRGRHVIPHAIVRIPGCLEVTEVTCGETLRLETDDGPRHVPFEKGHFR
ncbi:MAG: hypothetical protein WBA67_09210, partial [Jannaschia sp.]